MPSKEEYASSRSGVVLFNQRRPAFALDIIAAKRLFYFVSNRSGHGVHGYLSRVAVAASPGLIDCERFA